MAVARFPRLFTCAQRSSARSGMVFDRCGVESRPDRAPWSWRNCRPSCGSMATVMLFTLFYPKREIVFFFIPMPIWLLVAIYLFYPLIPVLAHQSSHVAVEAHLAGAGFAFLFKQFDLRCGRGYSRGRVFKPRLRIFSPVPREQTRTRTPNPSRSSASVGVAGKSAPVSVIPEEQLDAKLDEVLAKIAREGRSGLTEEELRVLQEASRRARIRRSDRI